MNKKSKIKKLLKIKDERYYKIRYSVESVYPKGIFVYSEYQIYASSPDQAISLFRDFIENEMKRSKYHILSIEAEI